MKITSDNLVFDLYKWNDDIKYEIQPFNKDKYDEKKVAIICSQKTNFIEGNTTNLFDANNILNNVKTKGIYKITEKKEIENIYNIYYNLLSKDKYKLLLLKLHKDMYKDIIDIKFIPGKIKINNNFTYINKLENIEKHWYLDNKLVLESLKKNQEFLMKIMKLDNIKDKVLNLFIWHANFEMIHPFPDGNGRVGRILLDNELMKIGLQPLILNHHIKKDYFKIIQLCEDKNISNELLETIVFIQNESKRTFIDSYEELNTEKTTGNKKLKMI